MSEPILDALAAAIGSTAPGATGRVIYVGWTEDGLPMATADASALGPEAAASLDAFRASRLPLRMVPFAHIRPAIYAMTGAVIDFADHPGRIAEDQVRYTVVDTTGARTEIAVGELGVLRGIVLARYPWQTPAPERGGLAVSAVPVHTVFTALPGAGSDEGLALLFEPTVAGAGNEPAFRSFVRNTIGRLLVLDESQPPEKRRGYLDAAGRLAGISPEGGLLGTLAALRRLGLVEFEDQWLQRVHGAQRRAQGGFIRALRAVGLVEVDDAILEELSDPRPNYDVDRLEIATLIDLAEAMFGAAMRAFEGEGAGPAARRKGKGRR